jgi:hypothetical protein
VLVITVHVFVFIVFASLDRGSAPATTHHLPSDEALKVTEVRSRRPYVPIEEMPE